MERQRKVWRSLLWGLLLLLIGSRSVSAADVSTIHVPLQLLDSRHLAIQARINGKGPFRMILDTGSPVTLLSGNAAQQCGLMTPQAVKQPTIMGMYGLGAVHTLQVGDIQVKDFDVMIMNHPIVELLAEVEGRIDGILGLTFFSHYRTTIDYANKMVSFTPVSYQPPNVIASVISRMMAGDKNERVIAPASLWGLAVDKPDSAAGVRITRVFAQSAAESAGLKAGDRLLTLDGRWTDSVADCFEAASFVRPGQTVMVKLLRDGKQIELPISPRTGL